MQEKSKIFLIWVKTLKTLKAVRALRTIKDERDGERDGAKRAQENESGMLGIVIRVYHTVHIRSGSGF